MDIEAYLYSEAFRAKRITEDQLRLLLRRLLTQTEDILECLDLPDKALETCPGSCLTFSPEMCLSDKVSKR